ncbi:MAG: hypothetical protein ABJC04_06045 [Verrucomicrobiota bacterium]
MNPEEENFESLRKLLALKKYEQPPPRYFSELPARIWTRLERAAEPVSFWEKLLPDFNLKPAYAYAFGLLACGGIVTGIGYGLRDQPSQALIAPLQKDTPQLAAQEPSYLTISRDQTASDHATNLETPPLPSLFNRINLQVAPVDYSPGE